MEPDAYTERTISFSLTRCGGEMFGVFSKIIRQHSRDRLNAIYIASVKWGVRVDAASLIIIKNWAYNLTCPENSLF